MWPCVALPGSGAVCGCDGAYSSSSYATDDSSSFPCEWVTFSYNGESPFKSRLSRQRQDQPGRINRWIKEKLWELMSPLIRNQILAVWATVGHCLKGLCAGPSWMGPWIIIKNAYSMCISLIHYTAEELSIILLFWVYATHTLHCNWFEFQIKFKNFFLVQCCRTLYV